MDKEKKAWIELLAEWMKRTPEELIKDPGFIHDALFHPESLKPIITNDQIVMLRKMIENYG